MSATDGVVAALRRWIGSEDPMAVESPLTIDERRRFRDRRATSSAVAAVIARSVGLAASFVAIPVAIGYLGTERYGILVALTSVSAMLIFADMGLGNGLLNVVSNAYGRGDRDRARSATSSAAVMLVGIAAILALVLAVVHPLINWPGLLNAATPVAIAEAGPAAAVVIAMFVVALPLGIVERLRMAFQEGFFNSLASAAGAVLALVALIGAVVLEASLPVLILVMTAFPLLAVLGNGIVLFRFQRPWLLPSVALARREIALGLARVGLLFLVLQVAVAVAFQSDVVVAAVVLGPEAAATYAVTLKIFLIAPTFIGFYLVALWPAYTEAIARGDIAWIRSTLRRSVLVALIGSTAFALVMVAVGPWLLPAWTDGAVRPPMELLVGAALWSVLMSTFTAISMLLNAASVVIFQAITATIMACASIVASVVLANTIGLPGVVFGTLGAYVVFSAIPISLYLPRLMRRLSRSQAVTIHG